MVKSTKPRSCSSKKSKSSSGKIRTPGNPTYQHSFLSSLCRHGSGSFTMGKMVEDVRQSRMDIGLKSTRPNVGKTHTEVTVLCFELAEELISRPPAPDGDMKFKAVDVLAAAAKEARETFDNHAHPTTVGRHMMKRVGRVPNPRKKELLLKLNALQRRRAMAGIPEEPQPAPNVARQASLAPTDVSDVEMEVEYTHHDANPFEGQSQDRQSAPPCTPQGLQPTLSYLTPPDTTSPLSRHSTRARFPQPNFTQPNFTPQEASPLGSTSYDMKDACSDIHNNAAGVGTSNAAGPSGAQPRAASGSTVIEGLADRVTHIMEEMREESRRNDVAMQEKSVLLQQMCVQLQEKDAALLQKDGALVQKDGELHTANASLVAHREREEVLEDRLDATVLMHADALAQLDDAMGEKDALVGQHHDLHMKHWAAQAASKCSVVLNEKRGTALENNMLAGIRGVLGQYRFW